MVALDILSDGFFAAIAGIGFWRQFPILRCVRLK